MKMEIWCGRCSDGTFRITINDSEANVRFVEVKMTPESFANMLANQPQECEGQVVNLPRIGKKKLREDRKCIYTGADTSKAAIRKWLLETKKEEGWEMNDQLSTQSSIGYDHKNSNYIIRYSVEKWV